MRYSLSADAPRLRQQLHRTFQAMEQSLLSLLRPDPMLQGSFYLLKRKCGKAACHCVSGQQLHTCWVLTRREGGKDRLFTIPKELRAQVRKWAAEYRRYHRARAQLVKRQAQLLALADELAQHRLQLWPPKKKDPPPP